MWVCMTASSFFWLNSYVSYESPTRYRDALLSHPKGKVCQARSGCGSPARPWARGHRPNSRAGEINRLIILSLRKAAFLLFFAPARFAKVVVLHERSNKQYTKYSLWQQQQQQQRERVCLWCPSALVPGLVSIGEQGCSYYYSCCCCTTSASFFLNVPLSCVHYIYIYHTFNFHTFAFFIIWLFLCFFLSCFVFFVSPLGFDIYIFYISLRICVSRIFTPFFFVFCNLVLSFFFFLCASSPLWTGIPWTRN